MQHGGTFAISAHRLFDGENVVARRGLVLIEDGRIAGVDRSASAPSVDLSVVDLGDVTLLPGLIDAHSHLAFDPPSDIVEQLAAEDDEALLGRMRRHAQRALRAGITTIRDLGDRNYLSLQLRGESGPEVLVAGPPITAPHGHCWFLGGEAAGSKALRAAVQERLARRVDVIKVMATGGSVTPGSSSTARFPIQRRRTACHCRSGARSGNAGHRACPWQQRYRGRGGRRR